MKKLIKLTTLGSAILVVSMLFSSCGNNTSPKAAQDTKDPKEKAEDHNDVKFNTKEAEKDAAFIVDAYSLGLYEIEAGKHAVQYAENKAVKDLASTLIAAHVNMNADIEKLAAQKQISVQKELTKDQIAEIKKGSDKKEGRWYNKYYLDRTIAKHKEAIVLYEEAAAKASDPDIRKFFNSSLPQLRSHADMAMNLKDKLK